jgi:hypothetical protein
MMPARVVIVGIYEQCFDHAQLLLFAEFFADHGADEGFSFSKWSSSALAISVTLL